MKTDPNLPHEVRNAVEALQMNMPMTLRSSWGIVLQHLDALGQENAALNATIRRMRDEHPQSA